MNNRISSINAINSLMSQRTSQNQNHFLPLSESSTFSRDLLELVWNRMGQMNITERALLISHLRSGGVRYEEAETNQSSLNSKNENNLIIHQDNTEDNYLGFRHYPISIDWNQIKNGENHYYSFFTDYGYFGASLVTSFSSIKKMKITTGNLYQSEYYHTLSKEKYFIEIEEYIHFLLSFAQIKKIIEDKYYLIKELPMIKLTLDIYEHYLFT